MKLSQCVTATSGELMNGDCEFSSLSTDTRHIARGDLFVALRGPNFDAHDLLSQAIDAGACGLVVERKTNAAVPQLVVPDTTHALGSIAAERRRAFPGCLVAITGSSGKTSVKGMLVAILEVCGRVSATRGNYNNQVGVPLTLMALDDRSQYAVVEMGTNSPGEIDYLAKIAKPQVALVNNVMPAHIAGFGTLEAIAREKADVYNYLAESNTAVINLNDRFAPQFIGKTRGNRQLGFYFGTPEGALAETVFATEIQEDDLGRAGFLLHHNDQSTAIKLNVLGRHNVANALAASACAIAAGAGLDAIKAGLAHYSGDKGRMQLQPAAKGAVLIDDTYNANPGSVRAAMDYLASRPLEKVMVLGDLGELGDQGVPAMRDLGTYAKAAGIDSLLTCGPLARQAADAFGANAEAYGSQQELIEALKQKLRQGTVVLVKGSRSARMENIVNALSRAGEEE